MAAATMARAVSLIIVAKCSAIEAALVSVETGHCAGFSYVLDELTKTRVWLAHGRE